VVLLPLLTGTLVYRLRKQYSTNFKRSIKGALGLTTLSLSFKDAEKLYFRVVLNQ
jgi:hypothetical protein